jgi:O-antigen ligase
MRDMTLRLEAAHGHSGKMAVPLGLICVVALAGMLALGDSLGHEFVAAGILGILFVSAILINPLLGIIALLGTLLLGLPGFLAGAGRLSANNLIGLILTGLAAIQLCMKRDFWFVRRPQVILLLLICAAFVVSLVHSWHVYIPSTSLRKDFTENTLFLLFSRLAFLLMLVNFVKTPRHVVLILFSLLAFTMVVIPSVIENLATEGEEFELTPGRPGEFRTASSISSWGKNPNRLAFMCNVSILLLWMFAQIWSAKIVRILAMPLILMLAAVVLTTVSRSGFLSLGLVFLFLLLQKGVSQAFRVGVVAAVVSCALVFFLLLPAKATERLLNLSTDQSEGMEGARSTQLRLETKEHALEIIAQEPLVGVGPGNFRWLHRQLYPYSLAAVKPPHDSYLWAATEGGVLALLLYLLLFFFIWRDIRAAHRAFSAGHWLWHVTRFLTGYLLLFLFFSNFADFWLEPHLYLLAGLSMLVKRFAKEGVGDQPSSPGLVT